MSAYLAHFQVPDSCVQHVLSAADVPEASAKLITALSRTWNTRYAVYTTLVHEYQQRSKQRRSSKLKSLVDDLDTETRQQVQTACATLQGTAVAALTDTKQQFSSLYIKQRAARQHVPG